MTTTDPGPSKGAGRPSCLAMNPGNVEASRRRRAELLAGWDKLPAQDRADLLERLEDLALSDRDVNTLVMKLYGILGWQVYRG